MTRTFNYSIYSMVEEIEKFARLQMEYKEQTLAEIITQYDFIVGSKRVQVQVNGNIARWSEGYMFTIY